MKNLLFILFSFIVLMHSCKETNEEKLSENLAATKINTQKKVDANLIKEDLKYSNKGSLRFLDNFIYRYQNQEDDGEVVLYYDYINKLVLYHPEDEMTDFVIIDGNGFAYVFYTGEHGDKTVQIQHITFTDDNPKKTYPLSKELAIVTPIEKPFKLNQKPYSREDLNFKGYQLNYVQYNDSLDFYITNQIDVNTEQLHAFEQLIGLDWNYPLGFGNLTQIVSNKQLIGKVQANGLNVQLFAYAPTDFYARIGDYTYSVKDENGNWVEEEISLMKYAIK